MSGNPPPYETAVAGGRTNPNVAVTTPLGDTRSASTDQALNAASGQHNLDRSRSNESFSSVSSDGLGEGLIGEEGRRSMDDERRDLPQGWVRCFDPKTEHHFYVDEETKRSTWLHPYDDPEFIRTLPETHPANPNSKQGQDMQKRAADEALMMKKMSEAKGKDGKLGSTSKDSNDMNEKNRSGGPASRNWFQHQKDKLIGTKEERAQAKEARRKVKEKERQQIRAAEEAYIKRRKELMEKRLNDPNIRQYYASDPYGYSAPSMAFSRGGGLYGSPYGYGYGGGYGRRYGGGYGMGGMGMGLPLMGGLGGGLLLGSAMSGGFGGYGGGYGDCGGGFGGGFDGGGGGGFDGGGGGGF